MNAAMTMLELLAAATGARLVSTDLSHAVDDGRFARREQ